LLDSLLQETLVEVEKCAFKNFAFTPKSM